MGIQKLVALAFGLALTVGGIFYFKNSSEVRVLRVVTWSNYFPEETIQKFSQTTGIRVELSYISSNEELLAKLKAGATGFDVIQPSDYMVRQMISLGMLYPLDHTHLPQLAHLDSSYAKLPYDPGFTHSVPFNWGTTGIAINTEKVMAGDSVSWNLIFDSPDPKRTALLDDMREVFAAAFRTRGKSVNTTDPTSLEEAKVLIGEVKNRILMFTSEPKPLLLNGELNIAHIYSCDGLQASAENPKIRFYVPKEGGIIWTDNLAIPKTSIRIADAHRFIDFFLDPENALSVVKDKWLATPNKTVLAKLPEDQAKNTSLYPPSSVLATLAFLDDIGETLSQLSRIWTEIKSS